MIQLVESGGPPFKVMGPLAALMDSQYGALFIYLFGHEEIFMKKKNIQQILKYVKTSLSKLHKPKHAFLR